MRSSRVFQSPAWIHSDLIRSFPVLKCSRQPNAEPVVPSECLKAIYYPKCLASRACGGRLKTPPVEVVSLPSATTKFHQKLRFQGVRPSIIADVLLTFKVMFQVCGIFYWEWMCGHQGSPGRRFDLSIGSNSWHRSRKIDVHIYI